MSLPPHHGIAGMNCSSFVWGTHKTWLTDSLFVHAAWWLLSLAPTHAGMDTLSHRADYPACFPLTCHGQGRHRCATQPQAPGHCHQGRTQPPRALLHTLAQRQGEWSPSWVRNWNHIISLSSRSEVPKTTRFTCAGMSPWFFIPSLTWPPSKELIAHHEVLTLLLLPNRWGCWLLSYNLPRYYINF